LRALHSPPQSQHRPPCPHPRRRALAHPDALPRPSPQHASSPSSPSQDPLSRSTQLTVSRGLTLAARSSTAGPSTVRAPPLSIPHCLAAPSTRRRVVHQHMLTCALTRTTGNYDNLTNVRPACASQEPKRRHGARALCTRRRRELRIADTRTRVERATSSMSTRVTRPILPTFRATCVLLAPRCRRERRADLVPGNSRRASSSRWTTSARCRTTRSAAACASRRRTRSVALVP